MQFISSVVKQGIPSYLSSLPLPDSFTGFFYLSIGEWIQLIPLFGAAGGFVYLTHRCIKRCRFGPVVNTCQSKSEPKIVTAADIEDLAKKDKVCYCRCWRSKKFPFCDGSHNTHNEKTGDNVGPLVLSKKQ